MPIYRGSNPVTPTLPGKTLQRVYRGSTLTWIAFEDQTLYYDSVGTYYLEIPPGARWAEFICLGGGGGGQGGDSALGKNGAGGGAGQWGVRAMNLDGLVSLSIVVGKGGSGGGKDNNGYVGSASYVYAGSITTAGLAGTGGGGWGDGRAESAGSYTFRDKTYYGGAGGTRGNPGQIPGGGGGGGTGGWFGGGTGGFAGGHGRVIINLYGSGS